MAAGTVECNTLLNGANEKASKVHIPNQHHDNGDIVKEQAFPFVLMMMTSWGVLLILYGMFTEFDADVLAGSEGGAGTSYVFCKRIIVVGRKVLFFRFLMRVTFFAEF